MTTEWSCRSRKLWGQYPEISAISVGGLVTREDVASPSTAGAGMRSHPEPAAFALSGWKKSWDTINAFRSRCLAVNSVWMVTIYMARSDLYGIHFRARRSPLSHPSSMSTGGRVPRRVFIGKAMVSFQDIRRCTVAHHRRGG